MIECPNPECGNMVMEFRRHKVCPRCDQPFEEKECEYFVTCICGNNVLCVKDETEPTKFYMECHHCGKSRTLTKR